jgi:hypothetical protein
MPRRVCYVVGDGNRRRVACKSPVQDVRSIRAGRETGRFAKAQVDKDGGRGGQDNGRGGFKENGREVERVDGGKASRVRDRSVGREGEGEEEDVSANGDVGILRDDGVVG